MAAVVTHFYRYQKYISKISFCPKTQIYFGEIIAIQHSHYSQLLLEIQKTFQASRLVDAKNSFIQSVFLKSNRQSLSIKYRSD